MLKVLFLFIEKTVALMPFVVIDLYTSLDNHKCFETMTRFFSHNFDNARMTGYSLLFPQQS